MALDAFLLENAPPSLGVSAQLISPSTSRRGAGAHVGDQVVHFLARELRPFSERVRDRLKHGLRVIPHGACPGAGSSGGNAREFGSGLAARRTNRMTLNAALFFEYLQTFARVAGTV